MKRYQSTDYKEYKETQIKRSVSKWNSVSFDEQTFFRVVLTALPKMVVTSTKKVLRPDKICCMGIRSGNEYSALKRLQKAVPQLEKAEIYGVDINPEVTKVGSKCFAEDFNNLPLNWTGKFDLIYSNSIDHAFDIQKTLTEWKRCSNIDRYILLSLSTFPEVSDTDIYGFEPEDVKSIFNPDQFEVRHVWSEYEQEGFFNVLLRVK